MASVLERPLPQLLEGVTWMVPLWAPAVAVMAFVPCPEVIVQPEGTCQLYVVPLIFVTE